MRVPFSWVFELGWEPLGFQTYSEEPFSAAASLALIFLANWKFDGFFAFPPVEVPTFPAESLPTQQSKG